MTITIKQIGIKKLKLNKMNKSLPMFNVNSKHNANK